ncbi:glycosyltransferase involved in cell wall biosynthesis [Flavobacteriaceae bacterium MAR_2010_105]|nr:glycosyltransferase involved in cell wall biosynthesis [Flavobacteriaceae bacterium MAR_2010_105]
MNDPFVTVLLPVYNGADTLSATLESLLSQSYSQFELLIGIDGSTDGSKGIAESFKDDRIQIFEHPQNLGLANNINALIAKSAPESQYIAMAEQDDVYVPQRLAWQVEVMQQNPEVGLVSGIAEFVSEHNRVLFPGLLVNNQQFVQGKALFEFLYIHQLKVVNTCMMFRRSVHEDNGLYFRATYGNFNVDWDYVLRFSLVSQVYGVPKKLVTMNRRHDQGSVTQDKWAQFKASRQLLKDFKDEFPKLISVKIFREALKVHRKIELGYRSRALIILYGFYYYLLYFDNYFLKYIRFRYKKFKDLNHIQP